MKANKIFDIQVAPTQEGFAICVNYSIRFTRVLDFLKELEKNESDADKRALLSNVIKGIEDSQEHLTQSLSYDIISNSLPVIKELEEVIELAYKLFNLNE